MSRGSRRNGDDLDRCSPTTAHHRQPETGTGIRLGLLLSAVNPKNLLLAVAAGATIGSVDLDTGETALIVVIFTALAALMVMVPVIAFLVAGERLETPLENTKEWLIRYNAAVMSVLFFVFGVDLLGDAIQILAG